MKIRAATYTQDEDGSLNMLASGNCLLYAPDCKDLNVVDPYISLNFGKYRVHLNREDFTRFCKKFLYDTGRKNDGPALLR